MGRFSYESASRARQKTHEQCFFSSTFCPHGCPQVTHGSAAFTEGNARSGLGLLGAINALRADQLRLIVATDFVTTTFACVLSP
jgi:hypothetical protein